MNDSFDHLFTIGYTKSYEEAMAEQGVIYKVGKRESCERFPEGYDGGIVFFRKEDAEEYLKKEKLEGYSVYGLDTTNSNIYWNSDYKAYALKENCAVKRV